MKPRVTQQHANDMKQRKIKCDGSRASGVRKDQAGIWPLFPPINISEPPPRDNHTREMEKSEVK